MEKRWTKAATILPPTIKVCGKRLRPFCLRHRVALDAVNSPALDLKAAITPTELVIAARILSARTYAEINSKPTWGERFWAARMRVNRALFVREVAKLIIYFDAQSLWPRFWEKGSGKPSGIPWPLAVVAGLIRNGCTLEEAWTMPEAEAVWLHMAHLRAAGSDVDIVSEEEWAAMQKYNSEVAAEAAAGKTENNNNTKPQN